MKANWLCKDRPLPNIAEHCRWAPGFTGHVPPFWRFVLTRSEFVAEVWQHVPYFLGPKRGICARQTSNCCTARFYRGKRSERIKDFLILLQVRHPKSRRESNHNSCEPHSPPKLSMWPEYAKFLAPSNISLFELLVKQYRFHQVNTPSRHFVSFLVFSTQNATLDHHMLSMNHVLLVVVGRTIWIPYFGS